MKLSELIQNLQPFLAKEPRFRNIQISDEFLQKSVGNLCVDSRKVKSGDLFFSISGVKDDGEKYVNDALKAGAIAVVSEKDGPDRIHVKNIREAVSRLSTAFYGNPSSKLKVIGVTGTSGKTTVTYLLESILKNAGFRVGVIGTVDIRFEERVWKASHTTPDAIALQRTLFEMQEQGCEVVVMEVSSHALHQSRVADIAFDVCTFLNLSPEHLDYHASIEDYFQAKEILFDTGVSYSQRFGKSVSVVANLDSPWGKRVFEKKYPGGVKTIAFSTSAPRDLEIDSNGISFKLESVSFQSSLLGRFNLSNILAAISSANAFGLELSQISSGIEALRGVPGRMETVEYKGGPRVIVDYAHKSDAVENLLTSVRELFFQSSKTQSKLRLVIGCGGDRDREKRPRFGELAAKYADFVCLTSDNPRTEDPLKILDEIKAGLGSFKNFEIEPDRRKAIFSTIQNSREDDVVLIAGKGHETTQTYLDSSGKLTQIEFDDRKVAKEALKKFF